jgi:hypothetical protein
MIVELSAIVCASHLIKSKKLFVQKDRIEKIKNDSYWKYKKKKITFNEVNKRWYK